MRTCCLHVGAVLVLLGAWADPVVAQGEAKRDIAALRAEIAKLRNDLESAIKEIKKLKDTLGQGAKVEEEGPFYRGRSTRFWLDQAKDADPKYRTEAVEALGMLAKKNKELFPVLVAALKDDNVYVTMPAAQALGSLGKAVVPVLIEVMKDKSSYARYGAATALSQMGPEAKAAVPVLIQFLTEPDVKFFQAAIETLGGIGAEAKPAIPAMTDLLGNTLKDLQLEAKELPKTSKIYWANIERKQLLANRIIDALEKIDPEIAEILPAKLPGRSNSWFLNRPDHMEAWLQAHAALKKKYQIEK